MSDCYVFTHIKHQDWAAGIVTAHRPADDGYVRQHTWMLVLKYEGPPPLDLTTTPRESAGIDGGKQMTIKEFIAELQQLDPNMMVLRRRHGSFERPYWDTMDGWWPGGAIVEVVPAGSTGRVDCYYDSRDCWNSKPITALEI